RRSRGGWDWGGLFAVDLRTTRVRRVKGLGNRDGGARTWVSQLLGSDANGQKVYVVLARERPATPREIGRLKARLRRLGMVVPTDPSGEGIEAQRGHHIHVDYQLSEYSVRRGRVRDIALLTRPFAQRDADHGTTPGCRPALTLAEAGA